MTLVPDDPSRLAFDAVVDGARIAAGDGGIDMTDPATGAVPGRVPGLPEAAIRSDIDAAEAARPDRAARTASDRAAHLCRWSGPIAANADEAEAIRPADDSVFGLAACFHTRGRARAVRVGAALEVGMAGTGTGPVENEAAPLGGVGQSGLGREVSRHGIEDDVEIAYLCIAGA